jgi:hypothetical protein
LIFQLKKWGTGTDTRLKINDVIFEHNGRSNFSVAGNIVPAEEGKPFSYSAGIPLIVQADSVVEKAMVQPLIATAQEKRKLSKVLKIVLGSCSVVAAGASAAGLCAAGFGVSFAF